MKWKFKGKRQLYKYEYLHWTAVWKLIINANANNAIINNLNGANNRFVKLSYSVQKLSLSLRVNKGLYKRTPAQDLWRGTHTDQIWYLGLGLLNETPIVAFLFIPVPSQAMAWCLLLIFCVPVSEVLLFEGLKVGQTVIATLWNMGGSAVLLLATSTQHNLNKCADFTVSSFPWVVCCSIQPGFNWALLKKQRAVKNVGLHVFISWPDLHSVSLLESLMPSLRMWTYGIFFILMNETIKRL